MAASGLPLVHELSSVPDVLMVLQAFSECPSPLLMESTLRRDRIGRYSFLTAEPFHFFQIQTARFGIDAFADVSRAVARMRAIPVEGLPPFQGGAAGLLSYELGKVWEHVPSPASDEFQMPALAVGLYDWVVAWDHESDRAWVISQGFPETDPGRRTDRAANRLQWVLERLRDFDADSISNIGWQFRRSCAERISAKRLTRQWSAPGLEGLTSNFSRDDYLQAIERVIEYIFAGDIFQANLSQRLLFPAERDPLELYARLRVCNPAPFSGFCSHGDWSIVSSSPERFVHVRDNKVETRPMKGTRGRRAAPEADLFTRDELRESEKDRAENVMIVDLLRNDLSRVCAPGSIRVPHLCGVETYETVQHLVSEIQGTLSSGNDAWNLLKSVFPGGSITGAPKVRAMEIIAELEPTVRGPYCGSLFYVGFDGSMDSSILIRTLICRHGWIQCPVGGGIVAQSDPVAEYEETLHKAEGMLRVLT